MLNNGIKLLTWRWRWEQSWRADSQEVRVSRENKVQASGSRILPVGSLPAEPAARLRQPPARPNSAWEHEVLPEVLLLAPGWVAPERCLLEFFSFFFRMWIMLWLTQHKPCRFQPDGAGAHSLSAKGHQPGEDLDTGREVQRNLDRDGCYLPDVAACQGWEEEEEVEMPQKSE